jgi:hypothetical protein
VNVDPVNGGPTKSRGDNSITLQNCGDMHTCTKIIIGKNILKLETRSFIDWTTWQVTAYLTIEVQEIVHTTL